MKRLGKYLSDDDINLLNQLLWRKIYFLRCSSLSANTIEKKYAASVFQLPFFWKDKVGNEQSKVIEFQSEWTEDEETLLDFYTFKLKVFENKSLSNFLDNAQNQSSYNDINSNISFSQFTISQIQILSRIENIDNETELNYDEGILFVDNEDNKILIAAELGITNQLEFIIDLDAIENRISELKVRKSVS